MKINRLQRDLFRHLLSELEKAGVTPEQLLRQSGIKEKSQSVLGNAVLSESDALVRLETALELAGDPTLALRLGQRVGI
ncbi:MAG: hypothetical protein ACI9Z9_002658, partial [Litorivivens sp.]